MAPLLEQYLKGELPTQLVALRSREPGGGQNSKYRSAWAAISALVGAETTEDMCEDADSNAKLWLFPKPPSDRSEKPCVPSAAT